MANAPATTTSEKNEKASPASPARAANAPSDPAAILARMREAQKNKKPPSYEERIEMLDALARVVKEKKNAICDAISADFGNRSRHETLVAEVFIVESEIKHARANLREWMEPQERTVAWQFLPASAEVVYQPLGVIGIISPWNYPVQLALAPLVGALAAGNRVMIKPSEYVPRTGELLAEICAEAFGAGDDRVAVVNGGPEVGVAFSKLPFDHLLFTGSTAVGRHVMRAAAENLTPVTLELGGKSPTIVGRDFAVDVAAGRIMMGKLFNSGQTCIAPDYVFVPESKKDAFIDACKAAAARMYPTLASNPDYTSIVNDRHYARLRGLLDDAKAKGAKLVELNPANETLEPSTRKLVPTLVVDASDDLGVMQEEIFGPVLPVKTYKDLGDVISYVNDHPRPLALYYFGHARADVDRVLGETISGGVSINETMLHCAQEDLPFGGVGASGMGHYHAFEGFETFSKKKPIFRQGRVNATGLLRPPFGKAIDMFLRLMLGK